MPVTMQPLLQLLGFAAGVLVGVILSRAFLRLIVRLCMLNSLDPRLWPETDESLVGKVALNEQMRLRSHLNKLIVENQALREKLAEKGK